MARVLTATALVSRKIIDAAALITDPKLSVSEGVFGSIFGHSNYYPQILSAVCAHLGVSDTTPWEKLPKKVQDALLGGLGATKIRVDYVTRDGRNTHWFTTFAGVRKILFDKYQETTSETMKTHLEHYIREMPCSACHGARLKPEILAVTVGGEEHLGSYGDVLPGKPAVLQSSEADGNASISLQVPL